MKNYTNTLSPKDFILFLMLFTVITINTSDFLKDIMQGDDIVHIFFELLTVSLSIGGIALLTRVIIHRNNIEKHAKEVETELSISQDKSKKIGAKYSAHIQEQFNSWSFTRSEKEVALLILKGLSFNKIAETRSTKEKTVRQQASSVYVKSGVSSRHELAAWFLEDLLI